MQIDSSHFIASLIGGLVAHVLYLVFNKQEQLIKTFEIDEKKLPPLNKKPEKSETTAPRGRPKTKRADS